MLGISLIKTKELEGIIQSRATTERWLKRSHDKVNTRNEKIKQMNKGKDDADKIFKAQQYHLEQKERTIAAKNNEIRSRKYQSRIVIDGLKECLDEKDKKIILSYEEYVKLADWSAKKIKENRRVIKCLRENVRARNKKIERIQSKSEMKAMMDAVKEHFNRAEKLKGYNHKLSREIIVLKKTLADGMAKGKIK